MTRYDKYQWDDFINNYPNAHLLQTSAWGELKQSYGWEVTRIVNESVGAQILIRGLPFGFSIAYIAKGPIGEPNKTFWNLVDDYCMDRRAIFLKVEPDVWSDSNQSLNWFESEGFRKSHHSIQPLRTILVDLGGEEASILAKMKQKTRYNIRLAMKRGVIVRRISDVKLFYDLMLETGKRDKFGIHSYDYYQQCYDLFNPRGECELLMAEYQGLTIGGVMIFAHGERAWYLFGASADQYRNTMAAYLLQWEAIRWARDRACRYYDLWGVPDEDEEFLESKFTTRQDGLWGVYRFKRGFGGTLLRSSGPWDRIYQPFLYQMYGWWLRLSNI